MQRPEKIALLTKVIHSPNSQTARRRLQHAIKKGPRPLILIDDLDDPSQLFRSSDAVCFQDRGVQHQMTLDNAQQYARHNWIRMLFILLAKLNS